MAITIVDWGKHYENYRTRELRVMTWVPILNKQDGEGYTELLDHPHGAAHFGAWCALVQVASRCTSIETSVDGEDKNTDVAPMKYRNSGKYDKSEHPFGRGILVRNGKTLDETSLARMTRIPVQIWLEVLPRLVSIGWISGYKYRDTTDAVPSEHRMNGMELNGKKRRGRGNAGAAASAAIAKTDPLYHVIEEAFKSKNDGKFSDYTKEGVCIHSLLRKARTRMPDDPGAMLHAMLAAFWKLKTGDASAKGFWRGQPFLPSALSPLWDRVLETMRVDRVDPEIMAIINGGAT